MSDGTHPVSVVSQLDALTAAWGARGITNADLLPREDGTIAASDRQLTIDSATLGLAVDAHRDESSATDEPLELLAQIGRGGMGVVHLAHQTVLRREVAIKRRAREGASLDALLKEAWVAASLEHPNVVPVHVLARVAGEPAVVMKRIEGVPWSRMLREPALLPASERHDPLAWHVRTLLAVCHAIALAHRRGILHLDLKPENVMIGTFGEVHVLDWGLAAGHGDDAPPWLPRATDLRAVAGTPEYMAPELALAAGDRISPRTDVYLLGAILHEIATGQPPHVAEHVVGRLFSAFQSLPRAYGDDVSPELAALLHRAMHRDPERRFDSVDALRVALEQHLAQRAADALLRDARLELEALERAIAGDAGDEVEVWRGFGACRFALREAREGRPDHPEIEGLRCSLHRAMARWALDAQRLDLARTHLDELGAPEPELEARLDALRSEAAASEARVRELEAMAHDESLAVGSAFRSRLAIALGFFFLVVNVAMAAARDRALVSWGYAELLAVNGASLALLGPYGWWRRRVIFRSRANAIFFAVCITTFFVVQGYWLAMWSLGVPSWSAFVMTPVFYFLAFGSLATLISARFAPSALLQIPTAIAAARWPEHALEIIGVGGGASAALTGVTWRDDERRSVR